ncbi:MAG: L-threonylcarbamoyladenylate synthase [Clostridiales bacterium]|nr:L-threonylcarbamoyladenylate synthase [Clostridiales bacterium]
MAGGPIPLVPAPCPPFFAAKGRPADNPLIVHIAGMEMLHGLAELNPLALKLIDAFWPGPLTLVLPKKPAVPGLVSAGLPTLALRWPSFPLAAALIKAAKRPIAAPSANLSGRASPTTARHVYEDLADRVPLILDGGPVEIGLESTVVDACGEAPVILRPGLVGEAELSAVACLPVSYAGAVEAKRPASPGMKYRHYAPKGELVLAEDLPGMLLSRVRLKEKYGAEPLLIVWAESVKELPQDAATLVIGEYGDLNAYACNLFAALRRADEELFPALVAQAVPEHGLGVAIMNRLRKAAGTKDSSF